MGWAKFDDRRHTNGKLITAGLAANGLDANGITYCAANETDGFLPDDVMPVLAPTITSRQRLELAEKLVLVGRWQRDDDNHGWWIHDFLNFHPSRESLEEKRAKDRDRKAAQQRDHLGQFHRESTGNPSGIRADSGWTPSDPVPSRPLPTRPDPSPPIPGEIVTSSNNLESVALALGARREGDISIEGEEKLRELITTLTAGCSGKSRAHVQLEATMVIGLCKPHAPVDVLEKAVMACVRDKPTLPRYLLKAFEIQLRAAGLPAVSLHLPEIGKVAS